MAYDVVFVLRGRVRIVHKVQAHSTLIGYVCEGGSYLRNFVPSDLCTPTVVHKCVLYVVHSTCLHAT